MEIKKAYFISPIVNMQILIEKVMSQARVSEDELRDMGELDTGSGKNFRGNIFATPESILSAGRRRRIFYMAKRTV